MHPLYRGIEYCRVSIQLVSPASGDFSPAERESVSSFPVSIQLVSPASGDSFDVISLQGQGIWRFHSIGVPSEWGPGDETVRRVRLRADVSIQLVSPASGDSTGGAGGNSTGGGFHSIGVPSEWGPEG